MSKFLKITTLSLMLPILSVGAHASTFDKTKAVGTYQVKENSGLSDLVKKSDFYTIDTYISNKKSDKNALDIITSVKTNPDWHLADSRTLQIIDTPRVQAQSASITERGYVDSAKEDAKGVTLTPAITEEGSYFNVENIAPNVVSISYTFQELIGEDHGFDKYTTGTGANAITTQIVNKASYRLSTTISIKPNETVVSSGVDSKGREVITAITRK